MTAAMYGSSPKLAIAAGKAVTTWECLIKDEEPFTFYPHDHFPVADVAWNHNGQVIATCSSVSSDQNPHNTVVLTAAFSGKQLDALRHNENWQRPSGATTSLAFGGKSRYLCIGDSSGAVCLWDLKKRLRVRQFFHDTYPSRQVSLDPTDTFVLSLSEELFSVYNLREGKLATSFDPQGSYKFTRYDTSTLEPNIAAVGTSDGSLLLYDITNLEKTAPFFGLSRRQGPITDIAFSPTNSQLLASTSVDGTLRFFDKSSGSNIETLASLKAAITSLTMHMDGVSCAFGTDTGEVILYDLRQNEGPLASMLVQGAVTALRFSPPPKNKGTLTSGSTPTKTPTAQPSLVTSTEKQRRHEQEQFQQDIELAMQAQLKVELPASLRAKPSSLPATAATTTQPSKQQISHKHEPLVTASKTPTWSPMEKMTEQPEQEASYLDKSSVTMSPLRSFTSPQKSAPQEYSSMTSTVSTLRQSPSKSPTKRQQPEQAVSPTAALKAINYTRAASRRQSAPSPRAEEKKAVEKEIDMEKVRDLVRDEVENLRDDLEEAIRNLHMDMISQFHQQSQELGDALSSQLETIHRLTAENERLREENEILRGQMLYDNQ